MNDGHIYDEDLENPEAEVVEPADDSDGMADLLMWFEEVRENTEQLKGSTAAFRDKLRDINETLDASRAVIQQTPRTLEDAKLEFRAEIKQLARLTAVTARNANKTRTGLMIALSVWAICATTAAFLVFDHFSKQSPTVSTFDSTGLFTDMAACEEAGGTLDQSDSGRFYCVFWDNSRS